MLSNIKNINLSWGVAITLLVGGMIVQITYSLEVFGRNSVIPLLLGLSIVAVGLLFVLVVFLWRRNASTNTRNTSGPQE